jgi:hypothetical protein
MEAGSSQHGGHGGVIAEAGIAAEALTVDGAMAMEVGVGAAAGGA